MKIDIAGMEATLETALAMAIATWERSERAAIDAGKPRLAGLFRDQIIEALALHERVSGEPPTRSHDGTWRVARPRDAGSSPPEAQS